MTATERAQPLDVLKPYPAYKDSGVEWIGEIPEHWLVKRVKEVAPFEVGGTPPTGERHHFEGNLPWVTIGDMQGDLSNSTRLQLTSEAVRQYRIPLAPAGSLLMSFKLSVGKTCFAPYDLYTNEAIAIFQQNGVVNLHYLRHTLPLAVLEHAGENIYGAKILNQRLIRETPTPAPPESEQQAIAAFLDHETARIDALVREQELLLEDLAERKHAICFHSVTRGITPSAEVIRTDHPWITFTPSHWGRWKVSRAFGALGSGTTPPTDLGDYYDGEVDWVNTGDLRDKPIDSVPKRVTSEALRDYPTLRQYPPGTVVMAMYGATIGKLGLLTAPATVNQACCAFVEGGPVHNRFAFYWLLAMRPFIVALGYGGGQPNISQQTVRNMEIIAPEQAEQLDIATFLDDRLAQIDALALEVRANIEDMKLLRSTLITAATTGKIDVRDWTPA